MATPTVADFRAHFPEFGTRPADPTIQSHLDNAAAETPAAVWGDTGQTKGILYLAAHTLALLPGAQDMRLSKDSTDTIYLLEWKRLMRQCVGGPTVAGDTSGVTGL